MTDSASTAGASQVSSTPAGSAPVPYTTRAARPPGARSEAEEAGSGSGAAGVVTEESSDDRLTPPLLTAFTR